MIAFRDIMFSCGATLAMMLMCDEKIILQALRSGVCWTSCPSRTKNMRCVSQMMMSWPHCRATIRPDTALCRLFSSWRRIRTSRRPSWPKTSRSRSTRNAKTTRRPRRWASTAGACRVISTSDVGREPFSTNCQATIGGQSRSSRSSS